MDPLAGTYHKLLQDGVEAGTTKQADINGLFDLTALNSSPAATSRPDSARTDPATDQAQRPRTTAPAHQRKDGTMPVVLENLGKRFGDGAPVLDDVNANIAQGRVRRPPRCVRLRQIHPAEHHRGTGGPTSGALEVPSDGAAFMFQDAALFPWLTARENIELALKLRGVGKADRRTKAKELLELVHLAGAGTSARTSSPAACASASRWPARSPRTGSCC